MGPKSGRRPKTAINIQSYSPAHEWILTDPNSQDLCAEHFEIGQTIKQLVVKLQSKTTKHIIKYGTVD